MTMKKLLRNHYFIFSLLGTVIFAVNAWQESARPGSAPARIEVTADA